VGQEVPLGRELELTDLYLDIQQIRFGDRLHIEKQVDPGSIDALVPAMILQPLIENAVIHGVCPKPGDATIMIRSVCVNGAVRLEVLDSGPGFCAPESSRENGIGLANTRARLQQLYGAKQTLECWNGSNGGATVCITIPFRTRIDSGTDDPDSDRRR
jgi:two-component system LytT family sensor kinase